MSVNPKEILDHGASVIVNANHGPRRRLVPGFMLQRDKAESTGPSLSPGSGRAQVAARHA